MVVESVKACAYPGLPVIFAEGYQKETRYPLHSHASLALTSQDDKTRTLTEVSQSEESRDRFVLGDQEVSGVRGQAAYEIIKWFKKKTGYEGFLYVHSVNENILTGSSDSGAAALVCALDGFFKTQLSKQQLCNVGRPMSETAYRSVFGGLSCCELDEKHVWESSVLSESSFKDVCVWAIPFKGERKKADEIHLKVVEHPDYVKNSVLANTRVVEVKDAACVCDLSSILYLMETDAKRAHNMFEDSGVGVITKEMGKLCSRVEYWRTRGLSVWWNVAGGSAVYVFCLKKDEKEINTLVCDRHNPIRYKVAGGAGII